MPLFRFAIPHRLGLLLGVSLTLGGATASAQRPGACEAARAPSRVGDPRTVEASPRPPGPAEALSFRGETKAGNRRVSARNPLLPFTISSIDVESDGRPLPPRLEVADDSGRRLVLVSGGRAREAHFTLPEGAPVGCVVVEWKGRSGPLRFIFHTTATATALTRSLAGRGDERLRALSLLPRLGGAAVSALEASFDSMPPRERRDALKVYAALRRDPRAAARLLAAATDVDPAVRRLAVDALAPEALVEAARRGSAEALTRASRERPAAVAALALERLAGEPPFDDARRALLQATDRLDGSGRAELAESVEGLPVHARARVLEVLVASRPMRPLLLPAVRAALEGGGPVHGRLDDATFERLHRTVRAAAAFGSGGAEALVAPLLRLRGAEEWMLRAEVYRALASLGADLREIEPGLSDPYPRVRIAALEAAVSLRGVPALATALRSATNDPWSSVRAAAVTLAAREDLSIGEVDDRSPRVRLAVLESWLGSEARIDDLRDALAREPHLGVRGGLLAAAADRCVGGLDEAAEAVLARAGSDDADAPHARSALAYLLAFEGKTRDELIASLLARGVPRSQLGVGPRCARKNAL